MSKHGTSGMYGLKCRCDLCRQWKRESRIRYLQKHGLLPQRITPEERFWRKVDKNPGNGPQGTCWIWTGGKNSSGYGRFKVHGVLISPHVFSYALQNGKTNLWVLHHCDNPSCVNPDHLFSGTRSDNMRDCARKGRLFTHPRTAVHGKAGMYARGCRCDRCKNWRRDYATIERQRKRQANEGGDPAG